MKKLTICFLLSLLAVGCSSTSIDRLPSSDGGPAGSDETSTQVNEPSLGDIEAVIQRTRSKLQDVEAERGDGDSLQEVYEELQVAKFKLQKIASTNKYSLQEIQNVQAGLEAIEKYNSKLQEVEKVKSQVEIIDLNESNVLQAARRSSHYNAQIREFGLNTPEITTSVRVLDRKKNKDRTSVVKFVVTFTHNNTGVQCEFEGNAFSKIAQHRFQPLKSRYYADYDYHLNWNRCLDFKRDLARAEGNSSPRCHSTAGTWIQVESFKTDVATLKGESFLQEDKSLKMDRLDVTCEGKVYSHSDFDGASLGQDSEHHISEYTVIPDLDAIMYNTGGVIYKRISGEKVKALQDEANTVLNPPVVEEVQGVIDTERGDAITIEEEAATQETLEPTVEAVRATVE